MEYQNLLELLVYNLRDDAVYTTTELLTNSVRSKISATGTKKQQN